MRTDCNTIRREIDEANLDAHLTLAASEHLRRCDECRRFHDDRRTLRGLMAELETVGAPADFDFRLRARLARERPSNGFGGLLLTARPLAAVALVVLIAVVAVVVKSRMWSAGNLSVAKTAATRNDPLVNVVHTATPDLAPAKDDSRRNVATINNSPFDRATVTTQNDGGTRPKVAKKTPNTPAGNVPRLSTRDSAGTGAPMITPDAFAGLMIVPVDARAFKLSIDNGRGGARTISLPPVSFGSQRLLAREASFVPVSSARGDW